jgi:DNA recombination protein RmuC
MEILGYILVFIAGAVIGVLAMKVRSNSAVPDTNQSEILLNEQIERWRNLFQEEQLLRTKFETQFKQQAEQLDSLTVDLRHERKNSEALRVSIAQAETRLKEQANAADEKIAALTKVRGEIEKDFKIIATQALEENRNKFIEQAAEKISPLDTKLNEYKKALEKLETDRATAEGNLSNELKTVVATQNAVRSETSKLVNALKSAPKTRGRWGEQTLRNVLELAGLSQYCDFTMEESFKRDGDTLRPDVIVNLPGGRSLVIDAKTSLSGYLDAVEATEENERELHLAAHVRHIRTHVRQLAAKTYWDSLTVTPDFVVMFIPGDNFYTAAIERDASLFEEAAKQSVVIVTPATLIALAKAIAYGWRQEKVAENAKQVHSLGRELYKRLATMTDHVTRCGNALGSSVEHFNKFIGSLESKVMPQARRFSELEVEGTKEEISVIEPIDKEPRQIRSNQEKIELGASSVEAA